MASDFVDGVVLGFRLFAVSSIMQVEDRSSDIPTQALQERLKAAYMQAPPLHEVKKDLARRACLLVPPRTRLIAGPVVISRRHQKIRRTQEIHR